MGNTVLVIGGNGFIGYNVISELVGRGISVKCLDINRLESMYEHPSVDYCIGDIWDIEFLKEALNGTTCVIDLMSTSMPNGSGVSLNNEIDSTLRYHDYILSAMVLHNVCRYVFPSSGGAIYGDKKFGLAYETDPLEPTTPYGVGKQLSEDIVRYYYNKCSVASRILRIGNVYGSPRFRSKAQGVIDVFIQKALRDEEVTIWGNAKSSIRDYIYIEDVASAISDICEIEFSDSRTYNVGTGIGTSLSQVLELINCELNTSIKCKYEEKMASGINSIVLSNDRILEEVGWSPKVSLRDGIRKTIIAKRNLLK